MNARGGKNEQTATTHDRWRGSLNSHASRWGRFGWCRAASPRETGIPDYFNTPNYANSPIPLPIGPISESRLCMGVAAIPTTPLSPLPTLRGQAPRLRQQWTQRVSSRDSPFRVRAPVTSLPKSSLPIPQAWTLGLRQQYHLLALTTGMRKFVDTLPVPRVPSAGVVTNNIGQVHPGSCSGYNHLSRFGLL